MKNTIKLLGIIALAAVIILSMAACNRSGNSSSAAVGPIPSETSDISSSLSGLDKFLTEYEKLIEDYFPLVQRAMAGDVSAAVQMAALTEKLEAFEEEFEKFSEEDFTLEQMQRIEEFFTKMMGMFGGF